MSEYKPVTAADHLGRFGAGLVGEGCPWATVQQMAEDFQTAAHSVQYAFDDESYDRTNDRRVEAALRAASSLLSSGSNP